MKITQLEIPSAPFQGRMYVYVKLHTDEGIVGIGEAACSRKENALIGALQDMEHCLIGEDHFLARWARAHRSPFWHRAALWDIKGKALNVPVYELLGGVYRHKEKAYCWIGGSAPQCRRPHCYRRAPFYALSLPRISGQRGRRCRATGYLHLRRYYGSV